MPPTGEVGTGMNFAYSYPNVSAALSVPSKYLLFYKIQKKKEVMMKKQLAAVVFLVLLIPATMAWAESPVTVSHTLASYATGTDSVVLNYNLTVKNTGDSGISNVTLAYVPLVIIGADQLTVDIGSLDPQAEIQLPFTLTTPMLLDQAEILQQPLFWAGEYTNAGGSLIQFPARSIEGGAL